MWKKGALRALTAAALLLGGNAHPAEPQRAKPGELDTVTVEAVRNPRKLREQVSAYVSSITRSTARDALARWYVSVCPLVAGLSRPKAEHFLQRISDVARMVGAPLAPENCQPNLLIVVTAEPDELLRQWHEKSRYLFGRSRGKAAIEEFKESDLPVRVWYNPNDSCKGMETSFSIQSDVLSSACRRSVIASRLLRNSVRAIGSAIVVIDMERLRGFKVGEIADYIAMIGLAEISERNERLAAPSILNLFVDAAAERPKGLSIWDETFLEALYDVNAEHLSQASEIKLQITRKLIAAGSR
jgi:hypothetical protein